MLNPTQKKLFDQIGFPRPHSMTSLDCGRNNQIFNLQYEGKTKLILKIYRDMQKEDQHRYKREMNFLHHCAERNIKVVPEIIFKSDARNLAILSFIDGRRVKSDEVTVDYLDQVIDFILQVNEHSEDRVNFDLASDSSFSVSSNFKSIETRINNLRKTAFKTGQFRESRKIADELLPKALEKLRACATKLITKTQFERAIESKKQIISPSDLGFHNILIDQKNRLKFLDFEYSGLDDPIKLICDFFCMPDILINCKYHELFLVKIGNNLSFDDFDFVRCKILLELFKIKWACIALSQTYKANAPKSSDLETLHIEAEQIQKMKAIMLLESLNFNF